MIECDDYLIPSPYSIVVNNPNKTNDCNLYCDYLIENLCYIITCYNCDCLDYLNKKIGNWCSIITCYDDPWGKIIIFLLNKIKINFL